MTNPDRQADLSLLRRFEPVVRYTRGERFYPMDVERYIKQCSLWVQRPKAPAELLIPENELTLDRLAEPRQDGFGSVYFVKFIEPLDFIDLARYSFDQVVKSITQAGQAEIFRAGRGRLARVGYFSRLMDAIFSLTLLLRGRVPGDTSAAAALTYRRIQSENEMYGYYGRVVRQSGWIALQYWFFYPFNNWRSGFFGVNDHEGDWEMITIYCSPESDDIEQEYIHEQKIKPHWVAYASHDFYGDDLRRHWDDPELEKVGEHPIIYAGAGSHASYFSRGEYLAELELPFLSPVARMMDKIRRFWTDFLRQGNQAVGKSELYVFRIPFVDYARGDGLSIGPCQEKEWSPVLLDPVPGWVLHYRGLWGLFAGDPIAGENAPAGPMYNRDGTVRNSWYDPLNWAGLDKVPPPNQAQEFLERQQTLTRQRCETLKKSIVENSTQLLGLGVEADAMRGYPHLEEVYNQHIERIQTLSTELNEMRRELTIREAEMEAFALHQENLENGHRHSLRAHIHRAHRPATDVDLRLGRIAEFFSAVSVGVLVISIVLLVVFAREYLLFGLAIMIGVLFFIESGFRRQMTRLVSSLSVGLAVVSTIILFFEFFWTLIVLLVLSAGLYIIWENLREIRA